MPPPPPPQRTLNSDCTSELYFSEKKKLIIKLYFPEKCYHPKNETLTAFLPSKIKSLGPLEACSCQESHSFFFFLIPQKIVHKVAEDRDQGRARVSWPRRQAAVIAESLITDLLFIFSLYPCDGSDVGGGRGEGSAG